VNIYSFLIDDEDTYDDEPQAKPSLHQSWLGYIPSVVSSIGGHVLHSDTQGVACDIVNDASEEELRWWPDLERRIDETVAWMWMPCCDFCTGTERQQLASDVTRVLLLVFAEFSEDDD